MGSDPAETAGEGAITGNGIGESWQDGWYSAEAATFGDRVTAAREALGLDTSQLAARLGIEDATLEAWEEDRGDPRPNRLQTLAGVLGVSIPWLISGQGEMPSLPLPDAAGPDQPEPDLPAIGAAAAPLAQVTALLAEMRSARAEAEAALLRLQGLELRMAALLSAAASGAAERDEEAQE